MSADQGVEASLQQPPMPQQPPEEPAKTEVVPAASGGEAVIATLTPPPRRVVGVPDNPRTGEPRRPGVIIIATVLCWLAVAVTGVALLWVYWDAVSRFAQASWLMGQVVTAPGSLERILLSVAVTVIALVAGIGNAIVGYYAWTGYRWTRIAGLISAALTCGVLALNPPAWPAVPLAVAGAGLLWLPRAGAYFTAWQARRHPEQVFAPPTVGVVYGPVPRFGRA